MSLLLEGVNLTLEPVLLLPGHVLPLKVFSQFEKAKSKLIKLLKDSYGDCLHLELLASLQTPATSHKHIRFFFSLSAHNRYWVNQALGLYTEFEVSKVPIILTKASSFINR